MMLQANGKPYLPRRGKATQIAILHVYIAQDGTSSQYHLAEFTIEWQSGMLCWWIDNAFLSMCMRVKKSMHATEH